MVAGRWRRGDYERPTLQVCRALIGQRLVRLGQAGERLAGIIVEAEAYIGQDDLGCHAHSGRTRRNEVMWGRPGHAYVYFTYGMHWMLNLVTERDGFPAAVLLRAVLPSEGLEAMGARRRGRPWAQWTDGPAKLCQAFGLDGGWNGHDLCRPESALFVERRPGVADSDVTWGPRVGLNSVPEPWKSLLWRARLVRRPPEALPVEEGGHGFAGR
jgi:DNA-3-methyladenine glycosylase